MSQNNNKRKLICSRLPQPGQRVELSASEFNHAIRVLRLRDGDMVEALDGQGSSVLAVLKVRGEAGWLEFSLVPETRATGELPIILEMAILKGDAMEWVIEKAVELGVKLLIPIITAHTVVQLDRKGPEAFRERWQKIADQALKQCGRLKRMEIALPISLEMLLSEATAPRLWCDETALSTSPHIMKLLLQDDSALNDKSQNTRLLIGPEGGWSEQERKLLAIGAANRSVSLGPLILRAETAALYAVTIVNALQNT